MKNLQFISPSHQIVDSIKAGFAFDQGFYALSNTTRSSLKAFFVCLLANVGVIYSLKDKTNRTKSIENQSINLINTKK